MTRGVYCANAEEDVVLADVEGEMCFGGGAPGVGPEGLRRVSPNDLIGSAWRSEGGGFPCQLSIVVKVASEDVDILRLAGRGCERGERGGVQPGDIGYVTCIDELEQVAVLDPVFRAEGLVLMVEVLAPLGEADGGKTCVVEAGVVAAAKIAVAAKDHDWL